MDHARAEPSVLRRTRTTGRAAGRELLVGASQKTEGQAGTSHTRGDVGKDERPYSRSSESQTESCDGSEAAAASLCEIWSRRTWRHSRLTGTTESR